MPAQPPATPDSQRRLEGSPYVDDDGVADVALAAALGLGADGVDRRTRVLQALQDARVLVPVVAVLGEAEVGDDGLVRDKSSDMAAVLLRGADGRLALLAFSDTEALRAWNPEARPVPTSARTAAQAAVQEQAAALLVDVAGPHPFVVEGHDLGALAAGMSLGRVGEDLAWIAPAAP